MISPTLRGKYNSGKKIFHNVTIYFSKINWRFTFACSIVEEYRM